MISGTSTGSMLASGLSVEKPGAPQLSTGQKQPMFYGQEMVDFYKSNAVKIFQRNYLGTAKVVFIWTIIFAIFGFLFYFIGHRKYTNPEKIKAQKEMHEFLLKAKQDMIKENQKEKFKELMKAKMIQ